MRAAVYDAYEGPITVRTVPDPAPAPDGVVVKVEANGICRSDWHAWVGHDPVEFPHVPGHECAGIVVATGGDVRRWRRGDRVIVPFSIGCGHCGDCRDGHSNVCATSWTPGFSGWGSFAELVAIRHADANLVALPDSVDFVDAASLGCRFMTAFWGLTERGRLRPGEWLAVFGAGGLGLASVMIGRAAGAGVVAVDIDDAKLAQARELGADATVNSTRDEPAEAVRAVTGGGAHVSIDAFGSKATAIAAIRSLRRRGRHVQAGLLYAENASPPVPLELAIAQELDIVGSRGMPAARYPALLSMVARRQLQPGRLVGDRVTLDQACAVLPSMGRYATRGVVVIDRF
jgi:alcohol dehydrogenase